MRLQYFSVLEQHKGWGAEYFLNRALNDRGIETSAIDYRRNKNNLSRIVLRQRQNFDGLLLQRGDYFPLEVIRAFKGPKVFLFTELVERCSDADHLFEANLFDIYLVRGPRCIQLLRTRGSPDESKITVFLSSFDGAAFSWRDATKDFDCVFIGTMTERRKEILRVLSKDFSIKTVRAFGKEASDYFNRSKLVLNIHAEEYLDTETRVYEALGSGACLVSEKLSEENPFIPGEHYVEASSLDQLKLRLEYYLTHEKERQKIAETGHREASTRHTYAARAAELEKLFCSLRTRAGATSPRYRVKALYAYSICEFGLRIVDRLRLIVRKSKTATKRLFS